MLTRAYVLPFRFFDQSMLTGTCSAHTAVAVQAMQPPPLLKVARARALSGPYTHLAAAAPATSTPVLRRLTSVCSTTAVRVRSARRASKPAFLPSLFCMLMRGQALNRPRRSREHHSPPESSARWPRRAPSGVHRPRRRGQHHPRALAQRAQGSASARGWWTEAALGEGEQEQEQGVADPRAGG